MSEKITTFAPANEKWVHPLREYVLNCRPYDDTQSVDG
jgi:hypothetical protein